MQHYAWFGSHLWCIWYNNRFLLHISRGMLQDKELFDLHCFKGNPVNVANFHNTLISYKIIIWVSHRYRIIDLYGLPSGLRVNCEIPSTQAFQISGNPLAPYTSSMGFLILALHWDTSLIARNVHNPQGRQLVTHRTTTSGLFY